MVTLSRQPASGTRGGVEGNLRQSRKSRKKPWWLLGAVGAYVLAKAKSVAAFFQFGQAGGVILSMLVSIGAYTLIAPFELAVGVAVLLLVHEIGHVLAAKRKGLPVSAPIFIPFVGALITMKRHPRNAETEAFIALGGPLLGTLGAAAVYGLGALWGTPLLIAVANVGFLFNLINLLPIRPLDGGRIVVAVTRWLWLIGLVAGLIVVAYLRSYLLFGVWTVFAWDLLRRIVRRKGKRDVLSAWAHVRMPIDGVGPEHLALLHGYGHRELPFTTWSDLAGQQTVSFSCEEIGLKETVKLPRQMIVHQVRLVRADRQIKEHEVHLTVRCQIECSPYESDVYFEVPAGKRWMFGAAYAALTLFLAYMIYMVNETWVVRAM